MYTKLKKDLLKIADPNKRTKIWAVSNDDINIAIDGLSEKQAEVIRWVYIKKKTMRQLAKDTDRTPGAIFSLKSAALPKLCRFIIYETIDPFEFEKSKKVINQAIKEFRYLKGSDPDLNFAWNKLLEAADRLNKKRML